MIESQSRGPWDRRSVGSRMSGAPLVRSCAWAGLLGGLALLVLSCGGSSKGGQVTPPPGSPSPGGGGGGFAAGVYSLQNINGTPDAGVYANANVAGIALRTTWATTEPAEGSFDWSYLDGQIAAAKSAGKRVSIYMRAVDPNLGVPSWVFSGGAASVNTSQGTLPVPWDPTYQAKWTAFIQAFGQRYASEPTIAYTRGSTEAMTNGWNLPGDDSAVWAAAGYSDTLMQNALQASVDTFIAAFPNTAHWAEVGAIRLEPQVTGQSDAYLGGLIANYGFSRYPGNFGVWKENLDGCVPDPKNGSPPAEWQPLAQHPGHDGAQMLFNVQDGPSRMNPCGLSPNTKQNVLQAAVQVGIDYGMPYEEIYRADVLDPDLQGVIAYAAQNLK